MLDGACVIHAAFLHPERASGFTKQLTSVGLEDFCIIHSKPVPETDPRLTTFTHYPHNARANLSLIDAWIKSVRHAQDNNWKIAAIFEDDIVFRANFDSLWSDIEPELATRDWDILTLHRFPMDLLILESRNEPTSLVDISYNLTTHCVVIKSSAYSCLIASLNECITRGIAIDFFYAHAARALGCKIIATTKNLTGQNSSYKSSIQSHSMAVGSFYKTFRCCETSLEYNVIKSIFSLSLAARKCSQKLKAWIEL